eukprot:GEMP01031102.1.p1 GENE.GEMP01031102.1~~GEMP01031102.1.p1  ORF type:complete len:474 (+),score=107.63 GEMP01031102.1:142-1563(+)
MVEEQKKVAAYLRNNFRGKDDLNSWDPDHKQVVSEMSQYSLLMDVPAEQKKDFVELCMKREALDRAMGSLAGLAMADSLGSFLESIAVVSKCDPDHHYELETDTIIGEKNRFAIQRGQWTDDTSMTLCLADSLLVHEGKYDGSDVRLRFANWWFNGYNNAHRVMNRDEGTSHTSVGLGENGLKTLLTMKVGEKPAPRCENKDKDAGSGAIARLCAVSLAYRNPDKAAEIAAEQSYTTQSSEIAADACKYLAYILGSALECPKGVSAMEMIDRATAEFVKKYKPTGALARLLAEKESSQLKEVNWNWRQDELQVAEALVNRGDKYKDYPCTPADFGSYSIDALAIALHSVYTTYSFDLAVEKAINFLGDANTTAAVTAQIAGAFYGYSSIHEKWRTDLHKHDEYEIPAKAALLYLQSESASEEDDETEKRGSRAALLSALTEPESVIIIKEEQQKADAEKLAAAEAKKSRGCCF